MCYIFDRFNNYDEPNERIVDPLTWIDFYSPARNIRWHLLSMEDYSLRNPKGKATIEKVHNIGNLFIIGSELNGRLNNLSPEEKITKIRNKFYQDTGNNKMLRESVDGCDDSRNKRKLAQERWATEG